MSSFMRNEDLWSGRFMGDGDKTEFELFEESSLNNAEILLNKECKEWRSET